MLHICQVALQTALFNADAVTGDRMLTFNLIFSITDLLRMTRVEVQRCKKETESLMAYGDTPADHSGCKTVREQDFYQIRGRLNVIPQRESF